MWLLRACVYVLFSTSVKEVVLDQVGGWLSASRVCACLSQACISAKCGCGSNGEVKNNQSALLEASKLTRHLFDTPGRSDCRAPGTGCS